MRFLKRFFIVIIIMKWRGAFVKSEYYIRPQILLYFYRNSRIKLVFFPVVSKNDSVAPYFYQIFLPLDIRCRGEFLRIYLAYFMNFSPAKAEDLKAAAIGHNRIFQAEFFMQSARFFYFFHFASHKQMKSVGYGQFRRC